MLKVLVSVYFSYVSVTKKRARTRLWKRKKRKGITIYIYIYIYYKVSESNYLSNNGRQRTTSTATTPCSTSHTTCPPVQPQAQPDQLVPSTQSGQQAHGVLNWSYFRREFSGKPEEDVEAHLLRTNDWMKTHNFAEEVKVQ